MLPGASNGPNHLGLCALQAVEAFHREQLTLDKWCAASQHGLHKTMAPITSDCGANAVPEDQMALITSDCVAFRLHSKLAAFGSPFFSATLAFLRERSVGNAGESLPVETITIFFKVLHAKSSNVTIDLQVM